VASRCATCRERTAPPSQDRFGELGELLAASDIVSMHLPLSSDTQGFLDPAKMEKGAILINTARGGFVKGESLHERLRSGHPLLA
jgi:phosphoglycerate dehydrogenase-like enzyme